jgi:release factor glutamine methyltransferase
MLKGKTPSGKQLYQYLADTLKPVWGEEAETLSKYLLKEIFDFSLTDIVTSKSIDLNDKSGNQLKKIIHRLKKREPIQYILGYSYFLDRKFMVTKDVLVPRPETEELVLWVLNQNHNENPRILDIGVGSGCIGISLAIETNVHTFTGLDYAKSIVDVAEKNAIELGVKMKALVADVLAYEIPDSGFDIIISNPPYVLPSEMKYMNKNILDFEPGRALYVPEDDPLVFYDRITEQAARILNSNGMLFFEINESSGVAVKQLLQNWGFSGVKLKKDIHDKDRFVMGRL